MCARFAVNEQIKRINEVFFQAMNYDFTYYTRVILLYENEILYCYLLI